MDALMEKDLRLIVFTDKNCGHCIGMKKGPLFGEFAKAHPEIEIVHMDSTKTKVRDAWADKLGVQGWPYLAICPKEATQEMLAAGLDASAQLAACAQPPANVGVLTKTVNKALANVGDIEKLKKLNPKTEE